MDTVAKIERTDAEWRAVLTPEQYRILREKGTERAGTGALLHNKEEGVYRCAGCDLPLFLSDGRFDSGCGWPSFFVPLEGAHITETRDTSHDMVRTEITCSRCGGHLGHVFTDGPEPTGLRYCVNSLSIEFEKGAQKPKRPDGETAQR
ncbi:MAG: peptide-methionine (R)-S-oxide reductase MsrB [Planctomycetota bacterium]|nr:peptide-methionine (R)-S-oxide reductase MsrB [Planctomycetota bacterium]